MRRIGIVLDLQRLRQTGIEHEYLRFGSVFIKVAKKKHRKVVDQPTHPQNDGVPFLNLSNFEPVFQSTHIIVNQSTCTSYLHITVLHALFPVPTVPLPLVRCDRRRGTGWQVRKHRSSALWRRWNCWNGISFALLRFQRNACTHLHTE